MAEYESVKIELKNRKINYKILLILSIQNSYNHEFVNYLLTMYGTKGFHVKFQNKPNPKLNLT